MVSDGSGRLHFDMFVNGLDHPSGKFNAFAVAVVAILLGRVEFEGSVGVGGVKRFFGQLDGFHNSLSIHFDVLQLHIDTPPITGSLKPCTVDFGACALLE